MVGKPRVEFAGAFYHVITRGNRRVALFHEAADYAAYHQRFERYRERGRLWCYAYVLLANYVHRLVETGEVPWSWTIQ